MLWNCERRGIRETWRICERWRIQFAWIEIRTRSRITKQPRSRNISGYFRLDSFSTSEKLSVYCQIRWNCVAGKYCPVLSAMIYRSSTSKTHLILKCDNSIFSPDTVIVPIVKPPMYLLDYKRKFRDVNS